MANKDSLVGYVIRLAIQRYAHFRNRDKARNKKKQPVYIYATILHIYATLPTMHEL